MKNIKDPDTNPAYYKKHPAILQPIDVLEHLSFNFGNAFKYLIRSRDAGNEIIDLKKSEWYFDRAFDRGEILSPKHLLMLSLYFEHANVKFTAKGTWTFAYTDFRPEYIVANMRNYITARLEELTKAKEINEEHS
jgi:hypothetical protein